MLSLKPTLYSDSLRAVISPLPQGLAQDATLRSVVASPLAPLGGDGLSAWFWVTDSSEERQAAVW